MSQNLDFEAIARDVELRAVDAGQALADYLAQHFADGLTAIDFERHRIADYIFHRTAAEVLGGFPRLIAADEAMLQASALETIKSAFGERLAELTDGEA
jgi:hypothetical protein